MRAFLASLVVFVTLAAFVACGDEDLEFGEPSDTPTPGGDDTNTPDDTATPTP